MGDVGTEEDDRLAEDLRPDARHQDGVDAAELDVDLQAEVGQRLRRRLVHVLGLEKVLKMFNSCSKKNFTAVAWLLSTWQ